MYLFLSSFVIYQFAPRCSRSCSHSQLDFLGGVQQSPDVEATWSASPLSWQLWPPDDDAAAAGAASSLTSPKLWAYPSQMAASSVSLADRPGGLCVVQRMKVVL